MSSFLKDMAAWKKDDEATEEDYFHQKCHLFNALLELIPRSKARLQEEVMLRFVTHLNDFDFQRGSRIDWFWQASPMLGRDPSVKRIDNPGAKPTSSGQTQAGPNRWETLGITKNLVLYLYLEMEKLEQSQNRFLFLRGEPFRLGEIDGFPCLFLLNAPAI